MSEKRKKKTREYIDLCEGEGMITCELCQRQYSEKSFYEHLETHTKEEVEALKRIAELSLKDKEAYEELCWQLIVMEHSVREERKKNAD